jgi:hypothetical protein
VARESTVDHEGVAVVDESDDAVADADVAPAVETVERARARFRAQS